MGNHRGEAIFHAAKLLQLYEETNCVEAVTEAATALLANRPTDHVRQVAWFLGPELSQALTAPASSRCNLSSIRRQRPMAPRSPTPANEPQKAAASLPR